MKTLKDRFQAKESNKNEIFPAPSAYSEASVGIYSLPPAPKLLDPDDVWIVTPGLIRVKPQFPRWLWRTCNDALDKVGISDWDVENHGLSKQQREKALTSALKTLVPDYPARPDSLLSPSRSVDKLRDVLDRAPKGTDDKDMESWEDGFSGETDYYWSNAYLEQLFQALIDVIEEHGIEGWRNARWEVYDKVSDSCDHMCWWSLTLPVRQHAECLGGISYNEREETLHDSAFAWLCGWLEHRSQTLSTRRCEYSEIGRRYNDMLPRLSIGKGGMSTTSISATIIPSLLTL